MKYLIFILYEYTFRLEIIINIDMYRYIKICTSFNPFTRKFIVVTMLKICTLKHSLLQFKFVETNIILVEVEV